MCEFSSKFEYEMMVSILFTSLKVEMYCYRGFILVLDLVGRGKHLTGIKKKG